ncbi:DUF177 domain-containing protein [Ramlibacter sp. AN1015]|uniref:YceD family protein n=1 Tax=Ramlibacter sp. AN1015 TaxID=3133428 RepID=UPI0030C07F6D
MPKEFNPLRLDVQAFAEDGAHLSGTSSVGRCERLASETEGRGLEHVVRWNARGELRNPAHVHPEVWLHLEADTLLSLTCQRCLTPVDTPVSVQRSFRFVADEATALAQDDEAEEDLLALSRQFDLPALVEDEILMEMPLVPRHEHCPVPVRLATEGVDESENAAAVQNPFAILGSLKGRGSDS